MAAFLTELGRYTSKKNFIVSSNGKIDPILRFFDLNTDYLAYKKEGRWIEDLKEFEGREDIATPFLNQFFNKEMVFKAPLPLATTIYTIYANEIGRAHV